MSTKHFDLTWEDKSKLMYGDMLRSKTIIQWLVKNKDSVTPLTPEHVAPGAVADDDIMLRDQPNNHTRAIWYHCVFVREVLDIVERLKNDPDEKVKNSPAANLCHGTPVPPGRSSVPVYCPSNVFPGLCGEDLYRILCLFAWYNGYQATKARESKTLERPTPDYWYPVTMNVGGKLVAGKVAYYATHVAGLQDVAEQLRRQEMAFQAASRGELDSAIREQARQMDKTMDQDDVVANLEDKLAIMETRIGNVDEWDDATRLRNIKQAISTVDESTSVKKASRSEGVLDLK